MISSSSTSLQAFTPPPEAAFLYMLPSQHHPGSFKLGVTTHPAKRFDALTKRFGKFDLQSSALVVATSRRAALDLEGVLQAVFDAPEWHVEAQLPLAKRTSAKPSDGDTEWYQMEAFDLMTGFVSEMIERDENCAFHRFHLVHNLQESELWQKHLCNLGIQTQFRTGISAEADVQQRLAQGEANFEAVQAWVQEHRHQLIAAMPFVSDSQGNRRRTFVYRADTSSDLVSDQFADGDGEDLASACIVYCPTGRGFKNLTYLGSVTVPADEASTYRVEFLVSQSFTRAADEYPMPGDLLTRIIQWLGALPLAC